MAADTMGQQEGPQEESAMIGKPTEELSKAEEETKVQDSDDSRQEAKSQPTIAPANQGEDASTTQQSQAKLGKVTDGSNAEGNVMEVEVITMETSHKEVEKTIAVESEAMSGIPGGEGQQGQPAHWVISYYEW